MICKKCGCIIEEGVKECTFCGEPAEAGQEDVMTRFVGDDGARQILESMPQLIALQHLEDVPPEKERMLSELHRLQAYFAHIRGKYATLGDLWLMRSQSAEPQLSNYTIGGGIATLFFYLILTGFFPSNSTAPIAQISAMAIFDWIVKSMNTCGPLIKAPKPPI